MNKRSTFVVALASLQRVFAQLIGTYMAPSFGENIESRASSYLSALTGRPESLRFKIALVTLEREYALLAEEAALSAKPLELQLKVLDLAESEQSAQAMTNAMFNEPPAAKLFAEILAQARDEGSSQVRIDFGDGGSLIRVWVSPGGSWKELMTVPESLRIARRGVAVRASNADYRKLHSHVVLLKPVPSEVSFQWESDNLLLMELGSA